MDAELEGERAQASAGEGSAHGMQVSVRGLKAGREGGRGRRTRTCAATVCERSEMPSSTGTLTAIAIAASSDPGSKSTAARPPLSATLAKPRVGVGGLRAIVTRRPPNGHREQKASDS